MAKRFLKSFKEYGIVFCFVRFFKKVNRKNKSILDKIERRCVYKRSPEYRELNKIISDPKYKSVFVFYPFVMWNLPAFQRPQQVASALANHKDVLYIYCTHQADADNVEGLYRKIDDNLILTVDYDFVKRVKHENKIIQFYSTDVSFGYGVIKNAMKYNNKILYEYIDGIDEKLLGDIPKHYIERHQKVMKNEDIYVVASADKLINDVKKYRSKNYSLVCNGVTLKDFKTDVKEPPQKLLEIKKLYDKVVCYYGALASWFDYDLLKKCAKRYPNYAFILIGIDFDKTLDASGVQKYKNIMYLGKVQYSDLIKYTKFVDLLTIPFVVNHITESTSPVKLFEYMATQKPILTTALPECRKYKSAIVAESHEDYLNKIEEALKLFDDKKYLNTELKEANMNTWESKAKEILELVNEEM